MFTLLEKSLGFGIAFFRVFRRVGIEARHAQ
jgi:hypothetical protein